MEDDEIDTSEIPEITAEQAARAVLRDGVLGIETDNGRFFDASLLEHFINRFYGYGNYQGDYWFVGMEEGGGNSFADVEGRLNAWKARGKQELEDLAEYHIAIGVISLFRERPKIQSTWGKLIRTLLAIKGYSPTADQVRQYQRDGFGRITGKTCLLELLPLPSPSTNHWIYGQHSQLPYLVDRDTYRKTLLNGRIKQLQQRITQYHPKVVLFYSFGYREYWQVIASVDFLLTTEGVYIGSNGSTIFIITRHPVAPGLSNDYWHRVGYAIRSKLA